MLLRNIRVSVGITIEEVMAGLLDVDLGGLAGVLFGGVFHPSDEERVEWVRQELGEG